MIFPIWALLILPVVPFVFGTAIGRYSRFPVQTPKAINSEIDEKLTYYRNMYYTGEIYMGTPGQKFTVLFDTGSTDFWLQSKTCASCPSLSNRFDPAASSTFAATNDSFSTGYGSGNASGFSATDTFKIGDKMVKNQTFGVATAIESSDVIPFDGILGLGFKDTQHVGRKSPLQNMVDQGIIKNNVFAFLMRKDAKQAVVSIGGYDLTDTIGDILWTPVISDDQWKSALIF